MGTSGEIAAIGGYFRQYDIAAWEIYSSLVNENLDWIQLAAQDTGNLDDVLIGLKDKILAFQVKDRSDSFTYSSLTNKKDNLLKKMFIGWKALRQQYPEKTTDVRLLTTQTISEHDVIKSVPGSKKPSFKTFLDKYWNRIRQKLVPSNSWDDVTSELTQILNCDKNELFEFIKDTHLSFDYTLPDAKNFNALKWNRISQDTSLIRHFIFDTVGKEKQSLFLTMSEFLNRTGLRRRMQTYFQHDFFVDEKHYQPIQKSITQLNDLTAKYTNGYIALVGSAGSGKSTLLAKWLQQSNERILKYFSYINQDMTYDSGYRGESKYFLHDLITQTRVLNLEFTDTIPGVDRSELTVQFREELSRFSRDFQLDGIKTFIIVDGLDHIEREQNVEYSLIKDLPTPESIPEGVYFILGSRTINGLNDLNNNIKLNIDKEKRTIAITPLAKTEVFNIVKSYSEFLLTEHHLENISLNTQGHPLFLRYTIERLLVSPKQDYDHIIEEQKFTGDIIDEYQKFWMSVEQEEELKDLLSIIARFRFSFIDLELLETNFSFSDAVLSKFMFQTRHFFYEPERTKWQYFHNSFKWFLEEQTAKMPLTGKFNAAKDEQTHLRIANCIEQSNSHYRWNIIYHLFKAKQHNKIISIATQDSFRQQWHQFRNHRFISEDISIASKAAYYECNTPAWYRYLLASSELGQRLIDFDPSDYFDLYLELGLQDVADSYVFNGRELLVQKGKALRYAYELIHKGKEEHARKIFDIAEPTYILLQSKEVDRNRYNPELFTQTDEIELIKNWASVAIHFQPLQDILTLIQSLSVKDTDNYHGEEKAKFRKRLKLLLLSEVYTAIAEALIAKKEWGNLIECLNYIEKSLGKGGTLLTLISKIFFDIKDCDKPVINYCNEILNNWDESQYPEVNLQVCVLYTYVLKDFEKAKTCFEKLPLPQWKRDEDMYRKAIFNYLFDYTRLYYILTKNFEASFESFIPEQPDSEVRVLDRQICSIARFYALLFHGQNSALNDINVHLTSILNFYHKGFLDIDYKVRKLKPDLLDLIISLSHRCSAELYEKIINTIANDWKGFFTYWDVDEIREIINGAVTDKKYLSWGIDQLTYLEGKMLEGKQVGARSEQCIAQARSWLKLKKPELAEKCLKEAFHQTFGVRGEKDYQLDYLVEWLPKINKIQSDRIQERLSWYLKRLDYVQSTTSHAHGFPALKILRMCLEWHAGNGFGLFKWLLLNRLIKFPEGLEEVLEFLLEKDKENAKIYSRLFTRILLFYQDNGSYGYHISRSVVNGLKLLNAIKDVIHEIKIYGIEEKKNEVIQKMIDACESNSINIGLSKGDYPVRDTYTSSETYKSLHLDSGESYTQEEALKNIKTIEQALEFLGKESENSHFDWTDVIKNLRSQLTEEKIRTFLQLKKFDSVKLAKIGTIAVEGGYKELAKEIGYEALSKSRNAGWLTHYDGGSKIKAYELLMKVEDKRRVSDLAFKDLAFSLKDIDDKRLSEDITPVLDIISPDADLSILYAEVETYIEELLKNATINENIFDFNEEPIDIAELTARLMTFLHEFPVSNMKEHLNQISIELYSESKTIIEHFLDQLYEQQYLESYLTCVYGIFHHNKSIEQKHIERLVHLLNDDRFDIMYLAYQLLTELGANPDLKFNRIKLPLIYEMQFDQKPELIVDQETRLKEIERRRSLRETKDPIEYIMFFKDDAKVISDSTGIPVINIAHRIMQIAEQEALPDWYNSFSEQQISGFFKSIEMNMPYIRPRMLRLWPALMKVIIELWKSAHLSFSTAQLLSRQIDPRLHTTTIHQRISEIQNLKESTTDFSRRSGVNEEWVNQMDESCFDKFLRVVDDKHILAELSKLKSLDDGRASEIRQSFISFKQNCNKKRHYFFEGDLYNNFIDEYLLYEGDEIILFNFCQTFERRKEWVAINPNICLKSGWTLSQEGNFRWVDSSGNTMVESIFWIDGNTQNYERFLYSETGYGWYVIASNTALQIIKSVVAQNLFFYQKCIREYKLYQRKYDTDIDARNQLFKSVPLETAL